MADHRRNRSMEENSSPRLESPKNKTPREGREIRAEDFENCRKGEQSPEQPAKGPRAESGRGEYEHCVRPKDVPVESVVKKTPERTDSREYENCQQRGEEVPVRQEEATGTEAPNEARAEQPKEVPAESPNEAQTEQPKEVPAETPNEAQTEQPKEVPEEKPHEEATESPDEVTAEKSTTAEGQPSLEKAPEEKGAEAPPETDTAGEHRGPEESGEDAEGSDRKNAETANQLRPDQKSFQLLEIRQNELETQRDSQREDLADIRQQAQQQFESMPPFGTPEYRAALKNYNELRLRQEQAEDALQKTEDALVDVNIERNELYDQAYAQKDKILSRSGQLDAMAQEQKSLAEEEFYRKKPNAAQMEQIITQNEGMMEDITQAEAGLDAMMAAQYAKMQRYVYEHRLSREEASRDVYFQELQSEYNRWEQQRSHLEVQRLRAEEDNKQLRELQEQQRAHPGLWQRLGAKFKGKEAPTSEGAEAVEVDTCPEAQELRALGIETVDLRECREEYRPQIVEGVRDMLDSHPELREQVREIRCYPMDNDITYAAYGPVDGDQPFGGRLELNSTWYSREDLCQELAERSRTGWLTPNASPKSLVSHELGHGLHLDLCARNAGVTYGEVPSRELYREAVTEYMDNRHADTIVEAACREQGIEFDSDEFADSLSSYGGSNYGEALAEAVAEVRNDPRPRPLARAIYDRLQAYAQRLSMRRKPQ